jgi:hypothetical protein
MWTIARYLSVAPFSLKSAVATSSGGKTLLVPTPYAIKMALLDAAIRTLGIEEGERLFPLLRDLVIALALPNDLIVMKGFSKIQRLLKDRSNEQKALKAQEEKHWPMQPTIAYREYVYYRDPFQLALAQPDGTELPDELKQLLLSINYVGKRGGFIQLMDLPHTVEQLSDETFHVITSNTGVPFYKDGTLQMLDDCGNLMTFAQASIYDQKRVTVGVERILRHVVLPYRLSRSSRSYSWYTSISDTE